MSSADVQIACNHAQNIAEMATRAMLITVLTPNAPWREDAGGKSRE